MNEEYLYHYTGLNNFEEIIRSHQLLFSSCKNSKNEASESEALRKILEKGIQEEGESLRKVLKLFVENYSSDHYEDKELINKVVEMRENSYMACFSETHLNSHLWKEYADNSQGVAIALKKSHITPNTGDVTSSEDGKRCAEIRCEKMNYNEGDFIKEIKDKDTDSSILVFYLDSFKESKYANEKEFRIIVYSPDADPSKHLHRFHLDQEEANGKIIRLFHLVNNRPALDLKHQYRESGREAVKKYLNIDDSHTIKKVYVKSDETKEKVEEILCTYNLEQEITTEKIKG